MAVHWSSSRLLLKILEFAGKWLSELRCLSVLTMLLLLDRGRSAVRSMQADSFGETNLELEVTSSTSSSTPEMTSTENNLDIVVIVSNHPNILPLVLKLGCGTLLFIPTMNSSTSVLGLTAILAAWTASIH